MKKEYEKPKTKFFLIQEQYHLLQASLQEGMNMKMSGYQKGGNGFGDDDGWED